MYRKKHIILTLVDNDCGLVAACESIIVGGSDGECVCSRSRVGDGEHTGAQLTKVEPAWPSDWAGRRKTN